MIIEIRGSLETTRALLLGRPLADRVGSDETMPCNILINIRYFRSLEQPVLVDRRHRDEVDAADSDNRPKIFEVVTLSGRRRDDLKTTAVVGLALVSNL